MSEGCALPLKSLPSPNSNSSSTFMSTASVEYLSGLDWTDSGCLKASGPCKGEDAVGWVSVWGSGGTEGLYGKENASEPPAKKEMSAGSSSMNSSDTCSCTFVNVKIGPPPRHCQPQRYSPLDKNEPGGMSSSPVSFLPAVVSTPPALPTSRSKALRLDPTGQTEPQLLTTGQNPTPGPDGTAGDPGGWADGALEPSVAPLLFLVASFLTAALEMQGAWGSAREPLLSLKSARLGGDVGEG